VLERLTGQDTPFYDILAGDHKFLYLSSERYQFATAHRFASFA
jgi:hypothetical protein